MESVLVSPAHASFLGIPAVVFSVLIPVIGVAVFTYIMANRIAPLVLAAPDHRFDRIFRRIASVAKLWLVQWRQPRYRVAGILHILLFAGFLILSIRSISLVFIGITPDFVFPGFGGVRGLVYNFLKDYAATLVFVAAAIAAVRRGYVKPARYAVPERYGKDHTAEAVFILCMIMGLIVTESLFEATSIAAGRQIGAEVHGAAPLSVAWFLSLFLGGASVKSLQSIHLVAYFMHDLIFFSFLCILPLGKHFHVITSLFNVFFLKLDKGAVKPVRWDVADENLDDLESFGVKKFEDFTWKHMLDFYSCADCGRCSDQCPANAVGRPLSPRFISIKARDYGFGLYPLRGGMKKGAPLSMSMGA